MFGRRGYGQPLYATARVDDSTGQRVNVPQPFSASTSGSACVYVYVCVRNNLTLARAPRLQSALACPAMPVPFFALVFHCC